MAVPEDTAAVDGVLHLMGDRVCRVGSSSKPRTEAVGLYLAVCQAHMYDNSEYVMGNAHSDRYSLAARSLPDHNLYADCSVLIRSGKRS